MGLIWLLASLFAFHGRREPAAAPALAASGSGSLAGTRGANLAGTAPAALGRCRSCRTGLPVSQHYHLEKRSYSESLEGTAAWKAGSGAEFRWVHVPCPRCGVPDPLNSLRYTWRQTLLMGGFGILFVGFFAFVLWMIFAAPS